MALAYNGSATGGGTSGAQASVGITAFGTGDMMVLWAYVIAGTSPIAVPAGWAVQAIDTDGSQIDWLIATREKAPADTQVDVGGGAFGISRGVVSGYSGGASFGEVSAETYGAGSATLINPALVTIDDANSMSVVMAGCNGTPSGTSTPSSGWTARVDSYDSPTSIHMVMCDKGPGLSAGTLDPGNVAFSQFRSQRIAYQIELVQILASYKRSINVKCQAVSGAATR